MRPDGFARVFLLLKINKMKLTTTMLFNNRDFEVSIVIYEEEQVVTIDFGEEDYHFTFKEFNQFVTMLEKIKPIKL